MPPPIPSPPRGEGQGEGPPPSPQKEGQGEEISPSRQAQERDARLTAFARAMRHAPTDAEARLWYFLRDRRMAGCKFRRQHALGHYIADFVCVDRRLVIELDGGPHDEPRHQERDARRTAEIERRGLRVLRFWNHEVLLETEAVLERIHGVLTDGPSPLPSPQRGEGVSSDARARRPRRHRT